MHGHFGSSVPCNACLGAGGRPASPALPVLGTGGLLYGTPVHRRGHPHPGLSPDPLLAGPWAHGGPCVARTLIGFSLAGGALSDAVDRRRLLLAVQVVLAATSVALAFNAGAGHPALWPLYVFGALSAGFSGADMQTPNAIVPRLVRRVAPPPPPLSPRSSGRSGWSAGRPWPVVIANARPRRLLDRRGFLRRRLRDRDPAHAAAPPPGVAARAPGWPRSSRAALPQGRGSSSAHSSSTSTPWCSACRARCSPPSARPGSAAACRPSRLLYPAPGAGALVGALFSGWVAGCGARGWPWSSPSSLGASPSPPSAWRPGCPSPSSCWPLRAPPTWCRPSFATPSSKVSVPDAFRGRLRRAHRRGGRWATPGRRRSGAVAALTTPPISVVSGGLACMAGALALLRLVPEFARYRPRDSPLYSRRPRSRARTEKCMADGAKQRTVSDLMTPDVLKATPSETIADVSARMGERNVGRSWSPCPRTASREHPAAQGARQVGWSRRGGNRDRDKPRPSVALCGRLLVQAWRNCAVRFDLCVRASISTPATATNYASSVPQYVKKD